MPNFEYTENLKNRIKDLETPVSEALENFAVHFIRNIGALSIARTVSYWRGENGNRVCLWDEALRIGERTTLTKYPLTLILGEKSPSYPLTIATAYRLNLEKGDGLVRRNLFHLPVDSRQLKKAKRDSLLEKDTGVLRLEEFDLDRITQEIERGATGDYMYKTN